MTRLNVIRLFLILWLGIFPAILYSQHLDSIKIYSKTFGQNRNILVYTPPEYETMPDSRFEVIYVFDAQARRYFDYVHSSISFLNNSDFPMIVVGVISENRNNDFLPNDDYKEMADHFGLPHGRAEHFLNFLSLELIPYIDSNYRTLPKRVAIGHSNGGTFLIFGLIKNPEMFDAYLLISPNWGYHNEQVIKRLADFDATRLTEKKYIYMCSANERKFSEEWGIADEKAIDLLKSKQFKSKIMLEYQDFFNTDNHTTVVPAGLLSGLRKYLDYQYFNADNLISYYSELKAKKLIDFTPRQLNKIAYNLHYEGKTIESIKILRWAIENFPEEMNLYDSLGEMYQSQNNRSEAVRYYILFEEKLEKNKLSLTTEKYNSMKKHISSRFNNLENNK